MPLDEAETLESVSTVVSAAAPRRTIKVVLIGDGGSGKTSMRGRFLTRAFAPAYRATIGADFITRTLPINPLDPGAGKAVLQIWDTAGQERFQSLGSAFYRGADAVILAMDVTALDKGALAGLRAWYTAFMDKAPGPETEEDRRRFCWVCAANKIDLVDASNVDRARIRAALHELVPSPAHQRDWGVDSAHASGAKEPANPAEVLARPDPTAAPTPVREARAAKRQSIRSIDVFHPREEESDDDELKTPPRQRVDSTLSVNAPSVYHTPRGSTMLSSSPSLVRNVALPPQPTSLAPPSAASAPPAAPASSRSTARQAPPRTPQTVHDLFHPTPASSTSTPTARPAPSSLSLDPPPPPLPDQLEQGFTLFYTSARSGHNLDRLFQHIVARVLANDAHTLAHLPPAEPPEQTARRHKADAERMRRTIRLASGKTPDRRCC